MSCLYSSLETSFSMTVWRVVRPITLARVWVEDQVWLAADLLPHAAGALAETLLAISLRPHLSGLVTRPKVVTRVGCVGGGGGMGGLVRAVVVIVVTDGPGST